MTSEFTWVAGVRFQTAGRVYYYSTDADLAVGDQVVVETSRGKELGQVVIAPSQIVVNELPEPPLAVIRKARPDDLPQPLAAVPDADEGEPSARHRVGLLGLPVKPRVPLEPGGGVSGDLLSGLGGANRRYLEQRQRLPRLGQMVETPTGRGRVIQVKVLRELVTVKLEGGAVVELAGSQVAPAPGEKSGARAKPADTRRAAGERGWPHG